MSLTRRQFLGAAAGGAAAVGTAAYALADGGADYAVQGIDVSRWQGTVNWGQVAASGIKFCFCKATEGTPDGVFGPPRNGGPVDPMFATNWPAIKQSGILRGAYHMVRPSMGTAKAQADHFLDTVNPTSGDLRPALDMEINDGLTPAQVWQFLQLMVFRIKSRIGRSPFIYTGYYYWKDRVGYPRSHLDCPLWFARWSSPIPANEFPSATWSTWTVWQYASTATPPVPGISGDLDRNAFSGSLAELNKFRLP
jgi:GH25 family lysozyme M1 (1,4-beta-N-acetylmuramidase)